MRRFVFSCSAALFLATRASAAICFIPARETDAKNKWAYEIGVSFITNNDIDDFLEERVHVDSNGNGGELYTLTASRHLGDFSWQIGNSVYTPRLEMPLSLGLVDENSRSPFLEYSGSVVIRWVDFPWNDYLKTTFTTGVGLNYSSKVYLMDIQRHPNDDRSRVKFNWPIQLTFALPSRPQDQLMLYIVHHSGGHVFDRGGINTLGIGYRRDF